MGFNRKAAAVSLGLVLGCLGALAAEDPKPLVRKDLLAAGRGEPGPPLRDIFRPKAAPAAPAVRRPSGPAPTGPAAAAPEAAPSFSLSISYLGSVRAGGRTIGLVLRGGRTLDVAEGDEVAPGYRVVSVTSEAIVVEGPNGERRTFTKQGDRP